jgi:hypothetical protein
MQTNQRVYRLGAVGRLLSTDCCRRDARFTVVETPQRAILAANGSESGECRLRRQASRGTSSTRGRWTTMSSLAGSRGKHSAANRSVR